MVTKTTFLSQNKMHAQLLNTIDDLESKYSKMNFILHENLYPLQKDSYHLIGKLLTQLCPIDKVSKAFCKLLFKNVYHGEVTSAGASHISFLFGIYFAKHLLRADLSVTNTDSLQIGLNKSLEALKASLRGYTKFPNPIDVQKTIGLVCGSDTILAEVIWEALQLTGIEGKIFVENGKQDEFIIELKEGYNFKLNPFGFMLKNNSWNVRNCKVMVVDGLVEKVSELETILNKCLETQQSMAIFAHGFSEEVAATLKTNLDNGRLNVQPIRIPSDIDSLNVANDIAVVTGSPLVSTIKGDMILFTNFDDLGVVDGIKLSKTICTIENRSTRAAVSDQVKGLLEKRQSYYLHEEVQELLDKRMRSLVGSSVVVQLPNMSANVTDGYRVKIDTSLRQVKTIINYGLVNVKKSCLELHEGSDKSSCIETIFMKAIQDLISNKSIGSNILPTLSVYLGTMLPARDVFMFINSAGIITSD